MKRMLFLGLLIVFLGSFALITVILNRTKFFEENKSASTIIALLLALGITYFGLYKSGFNLDVSQWFYTMGFSKMALDLLVFFGTLGVGILLLWKFKSNLLLIIGGFMIALAIMGADSGWLFFIGGASFLIWMIVKVTIFKKTGYRKQI